MKKKSMFSVMCKTVMVLLTMFSLSFSNQISVKAWDSSIPHEFTRVKNIRYPEWWARKVPGLRGWSTYSTKYNGQWAYCLESSKNTPPNGQYVGEVIENNEAVRKLMYYGFGGPGATGEFAPGYDLKAAICPNDSYLTNDDVKYLLTHIFLSGAYSGDWNGFSESGFNAAFGGTYGTNIMNICRRIVALPEQGYARFTPSPSQDGIISSFTANLDIANNIQITNTVKFDAGNGATVNIPLNSDVTIHIAGTTATQTGGTAVVYGGQSFYFTAPLNGSSDMPLTNVTGSQCGRFTALAIKTGSGSNQTEGTWVWDPDVMKLYTQIKWIHGTEIQISKSDNFGENVANAGFELKQWNKNSNTFEQFASLSYDAQNQVYKSGMLQRTDTNEGKFRIEETVPDGYSESSRYIKEFSLYDAEERKVFNAQMEGQEVTVKFSSMLMDRHNILFEVSGVPEAVTLVKFPTWSVAGGQDDIQWLELSKDSDGVWRAWKQMPEDGEYYIHAYYNTASQENKVSFTTSYTPEAPVMNAVNNRIMGKVSVVKSDEETGKKLGGAVYNITAKNDILSPQGTVINKAGDLAGTLTTDENGYGELNGLHLGQYILSEVKPPDGYHTGKDIEFNLTAENNSADIVSSELNVTDRPNRFKIKKVDKDTGEALKDAKFEIYDATADKTAGSLVSNKNGEAELSRLKPSLYYICEVKAPEGYKLNETKYYFEIDSLGNASVSDMNSTESSGAFFIDENGDLTVTVKNEINLWNLRLVKKNDAGKTLEDAEFTLYRDKDCTDPIGKGTTDENGRVNFDRIVAGEYYLLETKAPAGYRKIEDPLKVSLRSEDGKFSFYINDEAVKVPEGTEESYTLDVDYGWYLIDEVTNVEGTHSAASLCMVNTSNPDMTVDIKSDFPVIQKQIQEDDNRKNIGINSDGWNDVADFEIGQTVPYRYNSYVPDMNGYDTYYYAVHDKMNSALTFVPDSVKVKIGSMTLQKDTDYRVVTEGIDDGETFQIQIMDLKAVINRYYYSDEAGSKPETEKVYGQKILIEYDAVLNEDAQLDTGRPGFENDVKLEYSNNPDADGAGQTGETPWDTVVCFTFRMNGIKVNDQVPERKLEGAKFKLYSDKDCTQEVYVKKASKSDGYTVISRDSVAGSASPSEAVEIVSDENGAFNIIGLDSQVYFLKETKAPDGYRLLKDPIEIDVKAVYGADNRTEYIKGDGATDKTLRSLEATAKFKEFYTGVHSEYEKSLSTNVDTGTFNIKVVNKVGSKLPATGSAATIVLVCAGTAVMAAVLIKKKKNEKE